MTGTITPVKKKIGVKIVDASPKTLEKNDLNTQRVKKCRQFRRIRQLAYGMKTSLTREPVEMLVVMKEVKKNLRTPQYKYAGWGQLLETFKSKVLTGSSSEFYKYKGEDFTRKDLPEVPACTITPSKSNVSPGTGKNLAQRQLQALKNLSVSSKHAEFCVDGELVNYTTSAIF